MRYSSSPPLAPPGTDRGGVFGVADIFQEVDEEVRREQLTKLWERYQNYVFAGVFLWHLVYLTMRIGRDWRNFKLFGPNSLVPGLQDLTDIIAMFKWFFGKGPRPKFDRWTYWEKFDY